MLARYFELGGPLMYAVFGCWVLVLAFVLDRGLYWAGALVRRPLKSVRRDLRKGRIEVRGAWDRVLAEFDRSVCNLERLNAFSQLATSIGLFGTVVGIATALFSKGSEASAGEVPARLLAGLSTALFTTIGGLIVFLFGQVCLILFQGMSEGVMLQGRKLTGIRSSSVEE